MALHQNENLELLHNIEVRMPLYTKKEIEKTK